MPDASPLTSVTRNPSSVRLSALRLTPVSPADGWTMDSPVPRGKRASMPAFAPASVKLSVETVTDSVYVPGHTLIVSPETASFTAA